MEGPNGKQVPPILRDLPEELLGPRVLVRPPRPGDGAAFWEALEESREQVRAWLPWPDDTRSPADSESYARRAYATWLTREDLPLSIWDRATGRFLGGTGLHVRDWDIPAFEIGYWLRTSANGQGYMTETVRLLCQFTFETLKANRVFIRCDARNERSAAIPRRLGFIHEATLRNEARNASGELRDTYVFALTPEDYANNRRLFAL